MKTTRKGLGKGLGIGYKNIIPIDSHIHSLSAKGVKQKCTTLNMMGLAEIRRINMEKSGIARAEGKKPYLITSQAQIDQMPPFPFPHIGDYVPDGYEKTNEYFVDSSGFGSSGEPALTVDQFKAKMRNGYSYAITEAGQFQVYVAEFKKKDNYVAPKSSRVPRYTNAQVGKKFFEGAEKGRSLHVQIVETPDETLLVGYGWAVYGSRNKKTGQTMFYEGWRGYSRTTSKQLGQLGLYGADNKSKERREYHGW